LLIEGNLHVVAGVLASPGLKAMEWSFSSTPSKVGRSFFQEGFMPTRNVNLTDSFDVFIDEQIEAGRYRNASEVMRAGLRLLQQQTAEDGAKLAALRRLAKTGLDQLDQGCGVEFTTSKNLAKHLDALGEPKPAGSARRRT